MVKNKPFYMYLLASTVSSFGSLLSFFAIPMIVYNMYHSGTLLSLFELISVIISISLSIPFGFWLDRKNLKRYWIIFSLILGFSGLFVFFWISIYTLLLYNIICAFLFIGIAISKQALIVDIVKKDALSWANNVIFFLLILAGIIAPLVGGLLLSISWHLPFLIDSITFFFEVVIVSLIPFKDSGKHTGYKREKALSKFKETFQYVHQNRVVKYTLILSTITLLIGGGIKIINIAYFSDMSMPYILYGMATGLIALGMGIIAMLNTFKIILIKSPYKAIVFSLPVYFLFYLSIFLLYHSYFSIFIFILLGLGNGMASPNFNAVIQKFTNKENLTRIIGLKNTVNNASKMLSVIVMGFLVDLYSPLYIYLFSGFLFIITFIVFYPTTLKK